MPRVAAQTSQLEWSSHGRRLVSVDLLGALKVWQCRMDLPLSEAPIGNARATRGLAFSPDGKWLGVWSEEAARLVNRAAGGQTQLYPHGRQIVFDASSSQAAVIPEEGEPVIVVDLASGAETTLGRLPANHHGAAFNRRGDLLAAVGGWWTDCALWNLTRNEIVWTDPEHAGDSSPALCASGELVAATVDDAAESRSRTAVWELSSGKRIAEFEQPGMVDVQLSPDGRWAASISVSDSIDEAVSQTVAGLAGKKFPTPVGWQGTVAVWSLADGKQRFSFPCHEPVERTFSHDGRLAVFSLESGQVQVWDVEAGAELVRFTPPDKAPQAPALITPDGQALAWCGAETRTDQAPPTLHLLDLAAIRRQLDEIGLGW
jgi:WD40 repeat protein